jgi:hypothetical protein
VPLPHDVAEALVRGWPSYWFAGQHVLDVELQILHGRGWGSRSDIAVQFVVGCGSDYLSNSEGHSAFSSGDDWRSDTAGVLSQELVIAGALLASFYVGGLIGCVIAATLDALPSTGPPPDPIPGSGVL